MNVNTRVVALFVLGLAAAVAGGYTLGRKDLEPAPLPAATTLIQAKGTIATPKAAPPIGSVVEAATDVAKSKIAVVQANQVKEASHSARGASLPPNHPMPIVGVTAAIRPEAAPAKQGTASADLSQKFNHFRVGNKNVKSIYVDGGVVWVGTSGGVIRYETKTDQFKLYDATNGLLSNGVFHVGKLHGKMAVGTYGGGLSIFDDRTKKWDTLNITEGLGDAFVYDFMQTKSGDIWIATWSGVNRIRGGDLHDRSKWDLFTVDSTKGGLPNDWVYGLAEGKNGDVWLATEGGLAHFADEKFENWNHSKGLGADFELVKNDIAFKTDPSKMSTHHAKQKEEMGLSGINVAYNPNYIISLQVDADGVVWAGTWGGGLARFDGKKFRNYTVADGLPGNHVFMLHIDRKGQLWVGTNKGLARFKNGKFAVMTTADGLFSDSVFSMATSAQGDLWVGSFGGVARIRNLALK